MRQSVPNLRPWLFRIAHNRALDWLRRYEHRYVVSMAEMGDEPAAAAEQDPVERIEATALALSCFCHLPVRPRAAVILKDVLGHTIAEVSGILQMTTPAVKAALNRGRRALREFGDFHGDETTLPAPAPAETERYADLFNAQDWVGLRAMLAQDVKLDLVGKANLRGRPEVSQYFGRYACQEDVRLRFGIFEGASTLFVTQPEWPSYIIQLLWTEGRLTHIRDFRYVSYILDEFDG